MTLLRSSYLGLATKLFKEREGEVSPSSLFFEECFSSIDLFFAEHFGKECALEIQVFLACLMKASREGHLCIQITKDQIFPFFEEWKGIEKEIREGAMHLSTSLPVIRKGECFYLPKNFAYVSRLLKHVDRLLAQPTSSLPLPSSTSLNEEQQEALSKALTYPFSLITGGPGTGKTFTASQIVKAFPQETRIVLTAPTGKAAQQLGLGVNIEAKTLHALLGIRSPTDLISEGGYLSADLILVDECSMLDARLFSYFLASIKEGTRLVLMGDKDQLPPVESGSLFADLVDMGKVPTTRLVQCMRSERREILDLAEAIRQGKAEEVAGKVCPLPQDIWEKVGKEFPYAFTKLPEAEELLELFDRFRILSCVREGPFGVNTINQMCKERYERKTPSSQIFVAPILLTKNVEKLRLSNGEGGVLVREPSGKEYALFAQGKSYPLSLLPSFEYGYSLSVHKSQGSEYDEILLFVPKGSEVFGKEVLYTAVTRAKLKMEICGNVETIVSACMRSSRKLSGL